MQAQAQLSGQAPGQAAGQLASVSQNMNSLTLPGGNHRTWQTDSDVGIRRNIVEKILLLFQKRKPRVSQEWQQKLPEFVKRLEESLYRDASSKEEYSDLSTLEQRLRAAAKRLMPSRNHPNVTAQGANASGSSTIPTPGTTMIPTPGSEVTAVSNSGPSTMKTNPSGLGNTVSSNGSSLLQAHGMASGGNVSSMVPTPGLGSSSFACSEPSAGMAVASSQGSSFGGSFVSCFSMTKGGKVQTPLEDSASKDKVANDGKEAKEKDMDSATKDKVTNDGKEAIDGQKPHVEEAPKITDVGGEGPAKEEEGAAKDGGEGSPKTAEDTVKEPLTFPTQEDTNMNEEKDM